MKFQMQFTPESISGSRTEKKSNKPSMTIPDQSLTVAELVERNKRGLPLGGNKVPVYSADPEADFVPDIAKLDLAEIQEMKEQIAAQIQEKQGLLQEYEAKKKNQKVRKLEQEIEQLKKQVGQVQPEKPGEKPELSTNTP